MNRYEDIIGKSHPVSLKHTRMTTMSRAAQFAPFAALVGYGEAVKETVRSTSEQIELAEDAMPEINEKLCILAEHISDRPEAEIVYFQKDERKSGGAYLTVTGRVKRVDSIEKFVELTDKRRIAFSDIVSLRTQNTDKKKEG